MKRKIITIALLLLATVTMIAKAQVRELHTENQIVSERDSILLRLEAQGYRIDTTIVEGREEIVEKNVVTNPFWHNVFFTGSVGVHTFRGDFSDYGKFKETIDMDWFAGMGKWFTPVWGIKVEGGAGQSHGFMDSQYDTPYTYGDLLTTKDGKTYYRDRIKWWDLSVSGLYNITRAIFGYEGANSPKRMNQLIASIGVGYVGHYDVPSTYFVADEFDAHVELQYSRFIGKKKYFSIDAKARGLLYQTNFDRHDHHKNSHWIDANWGVSIGATIYLKHNVWGYKTHPTYTTNYMTLMHVDTLKVVAPKVPEYGQMTFYVFYPNNYSGRDDAPLVESSKVNAIDYLAGGIFSQKKYVDNGQVVVRLMQGKTLRDLSCTDIATVKASEEMGGDGIARGYEIMTSPMSLSMDKVSMTEFREKNGYFYAPIWDGKHEWGYRIDDATKGQNLSTAANYRETESFGLNSQLGLALVRENLGSESNSDLYSFADIYAALEGNQGYISQFADNDNVAKLRRIFTEGTITNISVTGVATSQDNSDANTATRRNAALAQNRAKTVLLWLKGNENVKVDEAQAHIFMVNDLQGPIHKVDDRSTRGLNAKLHRCVKVTISYMY